MPGALSGPHPGEEAGIYLLRSASATGTAVINNLLSNRYAGSADLRPCTPTALVTFQINAGTATASLFAVMTDDGWPPVNYTSLVRTASGASTALLTSLAMPFLVGRLDALAAGTTANLHIAAKLV